MLHYDPECLDPFADIESSTEGFQPGRAKRLHRKSAIEDTEITSDEEDQIGYTGRGGVFCK